MSKHLEYEPQPMARAVLIGCLVSAGLVVATLAWCHVTDRGAMQFDDSQRAHLKSGIEFPPLSIDAQRLESQRSEFAEQSADVDLELLEDDIVELHEAFRLANVAQFSAPENDPGPPPQEIADRLHYLSNDVVVVTGPAAFQQIGEPIFEGCLAGLDELLDALRRGDIDPGDATEDPPEQFELYRQNCGNMLPQLIRRGVIDDTGQLQHSDARNLVDILQRYRWADLIRSRYDITRQWSSYELELFTRWRIEDPDAFDLPDRHRYLERAQRRGHLPSDYDAALAEARLEAASAGSDAEKLAPFEQLAEDNPDNELYRALYERLHRR